MTGILFFGIRFDISTIILTNSLFILLYLLPFQFREAKSYRSILKGLFVGVNGIALFANCLDFTYFPFTLKRSNAAVLNLFSDKMGNDFVQLLPSLTKDYWFILLLGALFVYLTLYYYKKIEKSASSNWLKGNGLSQGGVFIGAIALSIILYRGGFQLKPISPVTAGEYTSAKYIPLVLNTPFSVLKTLDIATIEPSKNWHIHDKGKLTALYNPIHKKQVGEFEKLNVVIIALESFSKEYIGALNNGANGYTPFLDSIIANSLTFSNAYANGKTSIDGIPAIVSGIPTWMYEAYITSPYGINQINSLASLLKKEGYYTAFFHGGNNGTMGFDAFTKVAGYNDYFGRSEYNNEEDYDGSWGIWDEEFLQYSNDVISAKSEPFFATIFTLTSHHPYPIPEKYKGKFKGGKLPIHESISYSDFSLKRFFESAKKKAWFNNTLFVLCADHTGVSKDPFYTNKVGNYAIPIIYYMPGRKLKGNNSSITQQIDILPSVLDYINYPSSYFSFGNSVFGTTADRFAMTYKNNLYQLINNTHILQFDGEKATSLHNYKTDSLLKNDLIVVEHERATKMEMKAKAIIQTYQQSLINNEMYN